jgi:hypothetical protein
MPIMKRRSLLSLLTFGIVAAPSIVRSELSMQERTITPPPVTSGPPLPHNLAFAALPHNLAFAETEADIFEFATHDIGRDAYDAQIEWLAARAPVLKPRMTPELLYELALEEIG